MTYLSIPDKQFIVIDMQTQNGIGDFIRQRRLELTMSQSALADSIGLSRSHLAQIELGKIALPSADIRRRLAMGLGVSHLDLLVAAGEITPEEVPAGTPIVERDPDVAQFIEWIESLRWTEARISYARTVIGGMSGLD